MPRIIELMQARGYSPNLNGMCYGIAAMASQAVIRENSSVFYTRIKAITNSSTEPETLKDLQVNAFLDGVSIYFGRHGVPPCLYNELRLNKVQNISSPASFFAPTKEEHGNKEFFVPLLINKFIARFDKASLMEFLEKLKTKNKGIAFSLLITVKNHTVQIGFDNKQWLSVNHDKVENESELLKVIDNVLLYENYETPSVVRDWIASIDILSSSSKFKFKKSKIKYDKVSISKISLSELTPFLQVVLREGYHDLIPSMIKKISKKEISREQRYKYLSVRSLFEDSGLSCAFQRGHDVSIRVFFNELRRIDLSTDQIVIVLAAKNRTRVPGLYFAFCEGDGDMVTAFCNALHLFNLTLEEKADLLAAKDKDGSPGLLFALLNGHGSVVRALLKKLHLFGLTNEQNVELMAAKASDGNPGLFFALREGHVDALSAFIENLDSLGLANEEKIGLLAAKDRNGSPGLFFALHNGHDGTVSTFINGLNSLRLSNEEKVNLLSAKDSNGTSGLFFALQNGHERTVRAYARGVNSLGLSAAQKEELLQLIESPAK